ncbi:glycosyltransferase family 2 protein [Confluentibacter flavum]|uniref:glycosyltransferase family 2 protein n=1 Tax=Confluentibacter flavum TaxID=1909700 RepID=UPI0021D2D693|nr:glycosyltransferase family 2 protein [Confluentibacter flavum]
MPYYNRPVKLQRALDAVLNQTYQDFEIILIDDCSEKTPIIPKNNAINYVRNSKNEGPGYSRNVGLKLAKGDYVCFLDSDDYWHPKFLERCVEVIEQSGTEVAFVYVKTIHVKNGVELGKANKSKISESTILPNLLIRGRPWDTPACLWDKHVLNKHEGWINTRNWEDYAFDICAALNNNTIIAINEHLLYVDTEGDHKLSEQNKNIIETEKSKSLAFISQTLKNSMYFDDDLIRNQVTLHLINNTIALLILNGNKKKYINANIKSLKAWNSPIFVILISVLTKLPVKIGLVLLRRIRIKFQNHNHV